MGKDSEKSQGFPYRHVGDRRTKSKKKDLSMHSDSFEINEFKKDRMSRYDRDSNTTINNKAKCIYKRNNTTNANNANNANNTIVPR